MIQYPLIFEVNASSASGIQSSWEGQVKHENLSPILSAIPREFHGPGGGYSPEDLLALALANCIVATFKVFAEKTKFSFERIDVQTKLFIDRTKGTVGITKLETTVNLKGAADPQKAGQLLEEAKKNCLVSNALNVEKVFTFNVS
jgi:organic hydroperoxide reductase OsmC/OhrA